jgi:hypothetical protein
MLISTGLFNIITNAVITEKECKGSDGKIVACKKDWVSIFSLANKKD